MPEPTDVKSLGILGHGKLPCQIPALFVNSDWTADKIVE